MTTGNLQDALKYAADNPNSDFAKQLSVRIKSGQADTEAQSLGIDLSPIKSSLALSNNQNQVSTAIPQADGLQGAAVGVAKGELSTVRGLANIGNTIARNTVGRVANAIMGKGFTAPPAQDSFANVVGGQDKADQLTKPQGVAENIGYGAEKIGEFFLPASGAARAEDAVNLITKGIQSPLLKATARVAGKSAVQGLSAGGVDLAQTGGDIKQAAQTALTAGLARGGIAIIGEGAQALHLPERLYSTVFKNSARDMIGELKANGISDLQKSNPQKYQELVNNGIIKVDGSGQPIVNETLAEQALNRGLKGSVRDMASEVVHGTLDSENKVQQIAKGYTGAIDISEPQIINVLTKIGQDYTDVGFGEISNEAKNLVSKITEGNGQVSATDALNIRRFLDRVRIASSFDRPASALSQTQSNLKTLADAVREKVNKIPGMGETMKNYSFYINALDDLSKEAARRGNNQVLSMIDSLFLSGAYGGNNPVPGVTMGMVRKILQSASGTTKLGQLLNKNITSPLTNTAISSASSATTHLTSD